MPSSPSSSQSSRSGRSTRGARSLWRKSASGSRATCRPPRGLDMSKRLRVPAVAGALGLGALLAAARPARAEFGDPVRGQSLFVAKGCVQCHAVRGTGGRVGPDLGRTEVKGSFFEIAAAMWNHSTAMDEKMREFRVARPSFEKEELSDLLAFLYFLNYFDEPGEPRVGKVLFAQKHCIQCHSLGREGGAAGPRLDALP